MKKCVKYVFIKWYIAINFDQELVYYLFTLLLNFKFINLKYFVLQIHNNNVNI